MHTAEEWKEHHPNAGHGIMNDVPSKKKPAVKTADSENQGNAIAGEQLAELTGSDSKTAK